MQRSEVRTQRLLLHATSAFVLIASSCTAFREDYPEMRDPCEPINRAIWSVNRTLNFVVLEPVGEIYQTFTPHPIRSSIGNIRENLGGPLRITNQTIQGRWNEAGEETARFLTNTTMGIGGIFDVAGKMNLQSNTGSFIETFHRWGFKPDTFIVIPFLGPSDAVSMPGRILDNLADPSNYYGELLPIAYATRLDQLSDITLTTASFSRTEADCYGFVRDSWPYLARTSQPDWTPRGAPDFATLETLNAVRYGPQNPRFRAKGKKHFVKLDHTGRDLPYNAWIQKAPSPMVFINPGIGSHRESSNTLALAEMFHDMGYSVVTISGIFHREFMERGSSAMMPGNPRRDREDVLACYTAIHHDVMRKYPRAEVTRRVLAGFSMGGYATLQLAATTSKHRPGQLSFDHYLAINAPVDLKESYTKLDQFYDVIESWPENERATRFDNMLHKAASLANGQMPQSALPFDGEESQVLVGFAFRYILRDAMFSIHSRSPQPTIQSQGSRFRREATYRELMQISFEDYFRNWLTPTEEGRGLSQRDLLEKISLRSLEDGLRGNPHVTFIGNRNDFLLDASDVAWIEKTFGKNAILLPRGGHLGNLGEPEFMRLIQTIAETLR